MDPDKVTYQYLSTVPQRKFESSDEFIRWFQDNLNSEVASNDLKFSILEEDLRYDEWEAFRKKYCNVVDSERDSCESLVRILTTFLGYDVHPISNNDEMTASGLVDCLLNILTCSLHVAGNRNVRVFPSGQDRPDYSLGVVFVGVEKLLVDYIQGSVGHDPEMDLLSLTPFNDWSSYYGDHVSFIIGYTCIVCRSSVMFRLGVIDRGTRSFRPLHSPLDISRNYERPQAVEAVLLVRPMVHQMIRDNNISHLYRNRIRTFPACSITVQELVRNSNRVVEKTWEFGNPDVAKSFQKRMRAVFELVNRSNELCFKIVEPINVKQKLVKAVFSPMGKIATIGSVSQAHSCICDVIDTLVALRQLHIVHHDISLSNIIAVNDANRPSGGIHYVLIDFDEAQITDEFRRCRPIPENSLNVHTHSPASFQEHGAEVDVWSLGHLLCEFPQLPPALSYLGERIMEQYSELSLEDVKSLIEETFREILGQSSQGVN